MQTTTCFVALGLLLTGVVQETRSEQPTRSERSITKQQLVEHFGFTQHVIDHPDDIEDIVFYTHPARTALENLILFLPGTDPGPQFSIDTSAPADDGRPALRCWVDSDFKRLPDNWDEGLR